jgi:thymidine kinase
MFSGKTTELLRRLEAAPRALAFKHAADRRFHDTHIISHAGKAHAAVAVTDAAEILSRLTADAPLVVVDEGHFFDESPVSSCSAEHRLSLYDAAEIITRGGIDVAIAALQPDSWGRPFSSVSRLLQRADEPAATYATCARCGGRADRTQRLTPILDGRMVVSPDNYEPRCQTCWRPPIEPPPHARQHQGR